MIRRTFAGALILAVTLPGCAGDDERTTTGLSGGYNPTQTATYTGTASVGTTEDASTSGVSGTMGESDSDDVTSSSSDTNPTTTTTGDPTTTSTTTGDPTTTSTTTGDPTTTSTSTTTTSTSTSTTSTSTSTSTGTTGGVNDPQPGSGLYSDCSQVNNCDFLCLQLQDANMQILDGFCSKECVSANDCLPAPQSKATTTCIPGAGYCGLMCTVDADCPVGMTCEGVNVNNQNMFYCW